MCAYKPLGPRSRRMVSSQLVLGGPVGSDVSELELYVLPLRVYPRRCDAHPLPWGQLGVQGRPCRLPIL